MNWDEVEGSWKQLSGRSRTRFAQMINDEAGQSGGRVDELIGKVQGLFGGARDEAERQAGSWGNRLSRAVHRADLDDRAEVLADDIGRGVDQLVTGARSHPLRTIVLFAALGALLAIATSRR